MALGKGLGALIPPKTIQKITESTLGETGEQIFQIQINEIERNPDQPRRSFSHHEMEELINSIKQHGIIQPLILTQKTEFNPENKTKYQIVAGERRWRAAKVLNLKTLPGIIRSFKDSEKFEISLIENIQRKDLNPIERAWAYQRLVDEFNLNQEQLAQKLGKARASIANTMRLLTLPEIIQKAIEEEKITEGHAKALLAIDAPERQKILLRRILGAGLTVRETEQMVQGKKIRKSIEMDAGLLEKERELSQHLGTKVKIIKGRKKIKIIIETYTQEDLDKIINQLMNIQS